MKKALFLLCLVLSFTTQAQLFPSNDSLNNYIIRYVKNSAVESFTNLRMQNILRGLLQRGGGGSTDSFAPPLSRTSGIVRLDTTLGRWRSENYYNTRYQPIGAYLVAGDTVSLSNRINQRVRFADTAAMLSPYLRVNVAAATYQPIGTYLTTASNGLTAIGNSVGWGGTLTGTTQINTNGNTLTISTGSTDPRYIFRMAGSGIDIGRTNSGNHFFTVNESQISMYRVASPFATNGITVRGDSIYLENFDQFASPNNQVFSPTTTDTGRFQILSINKTTGSLARYAGPWPGAGGGESTLPYAAISSNYTITSSDYTIHVTANTITILLPTAIGIAGKIYVIKNSGTGFVTVDPFSSQTIEGEQTYVLGTETITIQSTGTNWIII